MLQRLQSTARRTLGPPHRFFRWCFSDTDSPLNHLGSLSIFFCWVVLVSGIWLLIFFRTSVSGAFESVQYLAQEQWYLGGIMRSLHRYASDALIVVILLHIVKEFSRDSYRVKRWFSWIAGLPLVWMVFLLGITGYWLVWDELAQYVAITSSEMLDSIPIFTDKMAANFLLDSSLIHIWRKKEIENYLLVPEAIRRVLLSRLPEGAPVPSQEEMRVRIESEARSLEHELADCLATSFKERSQNISVKTANQRARKTVKQAAGGHHVDLARRADTGLHRGGPGHGDGAVRVYGPTRSQDFGLSADGQIAADSDGGDGLPDPHVHGGRTPVVGDARAASDDEAVSVL